jgi:decaprenylphospho-beta-D-ribofuranose 2-oxidase
MITRLLYGWGRTAPSSARLVDLAGTDRAGLAEVVRTMPERGAIARGLGRSYGDSAQNGGGLAIRLEPDDAPDEPAIVINHGEGTVTAAAGVSLDELLRVSVPAGYFVPVTPGTRFVTIGGAIASDIHGKNHHVDGTFGRHVRQLTMMLADGSVVEIGPDRDPELFWATVGGMGLTGIILRATFSMLPIETSRCTVDTERASDLDDLMSLMADDDSFRYSVAWIDLMARGAALGRAVLTRGDHSRVEELAPRQAVFPLQYRASHLGSVPPLIPPKGLLNHATVAAFNEFWFRKAPKRRIGQIVSIPAFFHPLDAVGHWNRLYGRRGFLQYQFVMPFGEEAALRHVVERLADSGTTSFLAVLKRFGKANEAPLSFPKRGWTLALDVPGGGSGLVQLLAELDDVVLDAGGRHYLAKDAATTPEAIRRGYPRLGEWQAIRDRVDPHHCWASDQSRRLRLTEHIESGVTTS